MEEGRLLKNKTMNGAELGKSINNKNDYIWSQYKTYECGVQKGDKAKQVI